MKLQSFVNLTMVKKARVFITRKYLLG